MLTRVVHQACGVLSNWKLWVFALLAVVGSVKAVSVIRDFRDRTGHANRIEALVESEALILKLAPELKKLSTAALNLKLPDEQSVGLFEDPLVQLTDIAQPSGTHRSPTSRSAPRCGMRLRQRAACHVPSWRSGSRCWRRWTISSTRRFISSAVNEPDPRRVNRSDLIRSWVFAGWRGPRRVPGALFAADSGSCGHGPRMSAQPGWRIAIWEHLEMSVTDAPRQMFRTVLREALPDQEQRFRAERSLHEEKLFDVFNTGGAKLPDPKYLPYFKFDSMSKHPAISVVDIDRDGFDDLYVMARWGRNQLFRNLGDGTFTEIAGQVGLDMDGLCTGAIFGDFDNDGDADVFIGRWLEPSLYLVNMDGRFVDRSTSLVKPHLPALVTSLSAADYDGDGLLDIYFSTYAPPFRDLPDSRAAAIFLPPADVDELIRRLADQDESASIWIRWVHRMYC